METLSINFDECDRVLKAFGFTVIKDLRGKHIRIKHGQKRLPASSRKMLPESKQTDLDVKEYCYGTVCIRETERIE